jgi:hypothetical protein
MAVRLLSTGERAGRRLSRGIRLPDRFWIIALYVVAVITRLTFRRQAGVNGGHSRYPVAVSAVRGGCWCRSMARRAGVARAWRE